MLGCRDTMTVYFDTVTKVPLPTGCTAILKNKYFDGSAWLALEDTNTYAVKPTKFDDDRNLFLDPITSTPEEISGKLSGQYEPKSWEKKNIALTIEGDKFVYVKLPKFKNIVTFTYNGRLPAYTVSWKPLVFVVSHQVAYIKLTDSLVLIIVSNADESQVYTELVDYNSGFLCVNPCDNTILACGQYAIKSLNSLRNYYILPETLCNKGNWGYFIQFYKVGYLAMAKSYVLKSSSLLGHIITKKADFFAVMFVPPALEIHIKIDVGGKYEREVVYGKDYSLVAKKSSESDIDFFLLMDGQFVKSNFSYDIRINKPNSSKTIQKVVFKATIDKERGNDSLLTFVKTANNSIICASGCPSGDNKSHLVNDVVGAIFDAEITQYYSSNPGIFETCNMTKLANST